MTVKELIERIRPFHPDDDASGLVKTIHDEIFGSDAPAISLVPDTPLPAAPASDAPEAPVEPAVVGNDAEHPAVAEGATEPAEIVTEEPAAAPAS